MIPQSSLQTAWYSEQFCARQPHGDPGPGLSPITWISPVSFQARDLRRGVIRNLGVSKVIPEQLAEAQRITDIVCVQNFYNVANRNDDAFIDRLAKEEIAYVPFFAGRIHAATVIAARSGRSLLAGYSHAGRTCLASSAFSQHSAGTRHIFDKPSSTGSRCCRIGTSFGGSR
jgi:hypothetical protein